MSRKIAVLILLFVAVFFFASNFILLGKMVHPMGKDWHSHLSNSIRIIKDFDMGAFLRSPVSVYKNVIRWDVDYPPLYYVIAASLKHFFGISFMFMTSSLFLVLLIYFTYKIGELLGGWKNGILSASILAFYPMVYLSSRDFNLELAQAALVCAVLYALLRSEEFKNNKYSVLFGVFFGIGLLIKQQVLLFITGPMVIVLISLCVSKKDSRVKAANMIIAFLIAGLLAYIFFYHIYSHPDQRKHFLLRGMSTSEIKINSSNWLSVNHLFFYFKSLKDYQIGIANLFLLVIFMPIFLCKKEYGNNRYFLSVWVILPLVLLNLIPVKYHEYTLSFLPALAIATSAGIFCLRKSAVRICVIAGMFIANSFLFIDLFSVGKPQYIPVNTTGIDLLNKLKVNHTPASMYYYYSSGILKTLNPDHQAISFISSFLKNKKAKIGITGYISMPDTIPENELLFLFPLYTGYETKDLILDNEDYDLDSFDAIIFVSDKNRPQEQWLDKDFFVKKLQDYQNYRFQEIRNKNIKPENVDFALTFYLLYDELPAVKPKPNNRLISRKQLDRIVSYLPRLSLIKKIGGFGNRGDIFIYGRSK